MIAIQGQSFPVVLKFTASERYNHVQYKGKFFIGKQERKRFRM
jgi:hypothetical protein